MGITVIDSGGGFQQRGHKLECIVDITGSSAYVSGTSQLVNASSVMLSAIENVIGGVSFDGTYFVLPKFATGGKAAASCRLVWYVSSTGAEAGSLDLSGSTVRVTFQGY